MKYLKNLKFFTESKKYSKRFENQYTESYNIYESGSYSQNDDNIDNLIDDIKTLIDENIEYYVIKMNFESIIYFKIICFPDTYDKDHFLFNSNKYSILIDYSSTKRINIEQYREHFKEKSLKVEITKEYIDMIYQTDKYNL